MIYNMIIYVQPKSSEPSIYILFILIYTDLYRSYIYICLHIYICLYIYISDIYQIYIYMYKRRPAHAKPDFN